MLPVDCGQGVFVQAIVIAIVSEGRRPFGVSLELRLVVFLKQRVLRSHTRLDGIRRGAEGRIHRETAQGKEQGEGFMHTRIMHTPNVSTNPQPRNRTPGKAPGMYA